VNPNAPFSGNLRAQTASWIFMARLSLLSALVRKARVTKLPQRKLSPMSSTSIRTSLRAHGIRHRTKRSYRASGTYASQFAVSGLSAVHGAAQKLKTEMKRLAAFSLNQRKESLEFGVGQQGPQILAKDSGKPSTIGDWQTSSRETLPFFPPNSTN